MDVNIHGLRVRSRSMESHAIPAAGERVPDASHRSCRNGALHNPQANSTDIHVVVVVVAVVLVWVVVALADMLQRPWDKTIWPWNPGDGCRRMGWGKQTFGPIINTQSDLVANGKHRKWPTLTISSSPQYSHRSNLDLTFPFNSSLFIPTLSHPSLGPLTKPLWRGPYLSST